jgi:hypothetical protein
MDSDPDPDPAIFVIDLPDANKKIIKKKKFLLSYFLKVHLHHFQRKIIPNEVKKKVGIKVFLLFIA